MTIESLKFIADRLQDAGINYEFAEWTSDPVPDSYWVGEYTEEEPMNEDGLQQSTMLLTGTSAGSWLGLENDKAKIENCFSKICGKTAILPSGSGIAVFYATALVVPTGDATLKRLQVNLTVKEWSVN